MRQGGPELQPRPVRYHGAVTFDMRPDTLDRMVRAVETIRVRLTRTASALQRASVPFAVAGGHAVAAWVAQQDEAAVRNTRDVDILLRRRDLEAARKAMEDAGFVFRHSAGLDMSLESPGGKARDGVRVVFANERATPDALEPNPNVEESAIMRPHGVDVAVPIVDLEPLVRMKLTAWRDKDRTHLRDMIDVGLVGPDWLDRLPVGLAGRLQHLIETPFG